MTSLLPARLLATAATRLRQPLVALAFLCLPGAATAQNVNGSQQVVMQGLRSVNAHGSFNAAAFGPDGNLYLLLDQQDGIRLLKTDGTGASPLAQTQTGAAGDSGVAMAIDPAGNIYVTGTTTSASLSGTNGVVYPSRADTSINSFLAKYDSNLNLIFLTFLGSGRTAAASVAATADAVFVTGITFNPAFPVTTAGIQQSPAYGSTENGFVERFNNSGSALSYATYLTGAMGDTIPSAIVADANDNAYITGATSAGGFPTIAALQPNILLSSGVTTSGFLSKLTPQGDGFLFSTFIAGTGMNSLALDASTGSLLLSGSVSLGQFPVATVAMPLSTSSYQTLVKISLDGQTLLSSVLLTAATNSNVAVGPAGSAWVSGSISTPLFPGITPPDYNSGDSFLVHVAASGSIDQTLRFGGTPVSNAAYASMTSQVAAPAVSGSKVFVAGKLNVAVSSSLLATQTFDLPLSGTPSSLLPSGVHDLLPAAAACGSGTSCSGSGAFLAEVMTAAAGAALSVSIDDLPNVTLRNVGSVAATGIAATTSGYTLGGDCGTTLNVSHLCTLSLTGNGPGTLVVTAADAATITASLPATSRTANALALDTSEVDFGVVTVGNPSTQTVTITNVSTVNQTFTSAADNVPSKGYTVKEASSDCQPTSIVGVHGIGPSSSCHVSLALTASSQDGPVSGAWKFGSHDVLLTGWVQTASLSLSSTRVDFGTVTSGSIALQLPRYLYLSNDSNAPMMHASVSLPANAAFQVTDNCPSTLPARSVCQLVLRYVPSHAPSSDSVVLQLDNGLSALVVGTVEPKLSVSGSAVNPSLSVSASALVFATPVVVTGVSSTQQTLTLKNTAATATPLSVTTTGDFSLKNGCPTTLASGASCSLQIGFAPSQPGLRQGLISITSSSGFSPTYVTLSGTASGILPANNGSLNEGQTLVGEPTVTWYKVQQALSLLTATVSSANYGLALVADTGNGHGTLPSSAFRTTVSAACNNCWLGVQILSSTAGIQSATLSLSTVAAGNPYLLYLSGLVLPVQGLLLTPMQQDFGTVAVNSSSAALTFTVANVQATDVSVQSVVVSGDFMAVPNGSGGPECSGPLPATASCFVQIAFSPTTTGQRGGALTIVTSNGTATANLSGYGLADPGLSLNPVMLAFSNVPGSAATQQTITVSNTGTASVAVATATVTDPSFAVTQNCTTLQPGNVCSLMVTFTPQSGNVSASLVLPVMATVNGQSTTTNYVVPLSGVYPAAQAGLQIVADAVNFGSSGTEELDTPREFTLNNLSGTDLALTLKMPRNFPLTTANPCPSVKAGASCTFSVGFLPMEGGDLTGTVFAQGVSAAGSEVETLAYMQGYGTGAASVAISTGAAPGAPLGFGQVTSGQSSGKTITLTNAGAVPLHIRRLVSEPPFLATSTCSSTLAQAASCTVTVTYAPINEVSSGSAQSGTRSDSGTLVIESDAATSPDIVYFAGLAGAITSSNPASSSVLAAYDLSQSSLTFASTPVGGVSSTQTLTLTNTGTTTLHIAGVVAPADFAATTGCTTVVPGGSCSVSVTFTPGIAGDPTLRSGALSIFSDASDAQEFVSLVGGTSLTPLSLTPTTLNFGNVNVGTSAVLNVTVANTTSAPIALSGITTTTPYRVDASHCPGAGATLAPSASCSLSVTFAPVAVGATSGVLSVANSATATPLTVSLTGTGVQAHLQVAPTMLDFGSVAQGASSQLTIMLTNVGNVAITNIGSAVTGINAAEFSVVSPCVSSTLVVGASCSLTVAFTPSGTGPAFASLTVNSSDPNGPASVTLSGTGVQGGSFVLSVNGGSASTVTVTSGSPATYALSLMPLNGFTGPVALTCAPVSPAPYANCSLLSSTLTLSGGAQSSTATINTITSHAGGVLAFMGLLVLAPLGLLKRRQVRTWAAVGVVLLWAAGCTGCGGGGGAVPVLKTPAGTYQYQVNANSTGGLSLSSTVTLNLVVQ